MIVNCLEDNLVKAKGEIDGKKEDEGAGTGRTAGVVEVQSTRRSVSALTQVWPVGASDRRRVWRGPWCAWASVIRRGSPSHFSTADQTGWWRLTLRSRL
ncbi:hypothetical protein ACOMHN_041194 [Nucella lapillus]